MTLAAVLNLVLAVALVAAVLRLLSWAIISSASDGPPVAPFAGSAAGVSSVPV